SAIRIRRVGLEVHVDPWGLTEESEADYILLTHPHYDNFSEEDIARVRGPETVLIAPASMKKQIHEADHLLRPGDLLQLEGLDVLAVPAYNREKKFHPRDSGWLGYVFTVEGHHLLPRRRHRLPRVHARNPLRRGLPPLRRPLHHEPRGRGPGGGGVRGLGGRADPLGRRGGLPARRRAPGPALRRPGRDPRAGGRGGGRSPGARGLLAGRSSLPDPTIRSVRERRRCPSEPSSP
ncbi:MAG: hypothetical protein GWM92_18875, partial [Gemmatimonadetes bacterium]|nr:MBL fold metallo-hydrolase [Gemmatimonadota bacterium]NIR80866.1 MBL fold metallo-hydrolase [Gemmatimonadota bacterium]NIT89685.1 MBL fold metallo-hydrolase [Gemmatimonadota bacterium]NIU33465.1 MBL fold metallo-hydrolase [Gemmatimonadota bacterium]NIU37751.1 hypothetical protein [Gemmatimonadota bacterium]